jgi:predicted flap endonuclease-1-like 5' DNA nuclease
VTATTPVTTGMEPTTNLGRTTDEHKAMLDHLITIGTALNTNATEWARVDGAAKPKDLAAVDGIGPKFEQELHFANIETLEQLANIDDQTRARLDEVAGFPYASLTDWIEQAKDLTRESRRLDLDAVAYRAAVLEAAGHPIDPTGTVEKVMRSDSEGGQAVVASFRVYTAPQPEARVAGEAERSLVPGHDASRRLEAALKSVAEACDGTPRVPDLVASDVATLRRVRDLLETGGTIDDHIEDLNDALEDARIRLRHEPDPASAATRYSNVGLDVASGYDNVDIVGGGPYGNVGLPVASGYDDVDIVGGGPYGNAGLPVASGYDDVNPFASEFAVRSGSGGARVQGSGFHSAQPHEPGTGDSADRAVAAAEPPGAEAEQAAPAEEEER